MKKNRFKQTGTFLTHEDLKRRKREMIIIVITIILFALLTYIENKRIYFGTQIPVSSTILMFILININLLLLLLLVFLVFRNLVKLLYDRRRKVMGSKLRTRLVISFIVVTLIPTTVLFFFSINFITSSIEFWFNVPVEKALDNSLKVGRKLYEYVEADNAFFIRKIASEIEGKGYIKKKNRKKLPLYLKKAVDGYNLGALEVYDANFYRISFATRLKNINFSPVDPESLTLAKENKSVYTISENIANGELSRTIATIPFPFSGNKAKGYIVLSTFIPPELLENLTAISKGYEEYQQIKLLKKPIQATYYIILSIVALLVLFCAIWFGFYLAKSISIPIKELAEGTRKVAEGDLGFSIAMVADEEIGSLVESFNQMTKDLRISRSQLELSARILRQQNEEIEERRRYMEIVLRNVSTGVISMDAGGFITMVNKSAENMLGINSDLIIDKNYKMLLSGKHLETANEIVERLAVSRGNNVEMPLRLTLSDKPRSFMVHVTGLKNDKGDHVGMVVVFDDLTGQEKAQRMAAWREVARRIAHEVKNPLTPISLSAQRLRRRYSDRIKEEVFDECTRMIIDQVKLIRNLVNEFSTFARFPSANPELCRLLPIIEEAVALYRESHPDICFKLDIPEDMVKLNLDRQQIKQAMINLLDNAIAAMKRKGEISISVVHDRILKTVKIVVADTGPGISARDKAHLFEPYFSTKKRGMGLGLTIVSTIIADHKGTIQVQDNHPKGTRFIIELPE